MNKNIGKNMGIVAVSAFSIQLIFKLMGNGNKAAVIQGVLIIVLCIVLAVYMYGATKKKLGNKVSMVGAILLSATGISIAVGYIIMECYPELYKQYRAGCIYRPWKLYCFNDIFHNSCYYCFK